MSKLYFQGDKRRNFAKSNQGGWAAFENENIETQVEHINEDEKNVEYSECNYTISTTGHLKKHSRGAHHKNRNIKWPDCEYRTAKPSHLKMHIKRVYEK